MCVYVYSVYVCVCVCVCGVVVWCEYVAIVACVECVHVHTTAHIQHTYLTHTHTTQPHTTQHQNRTHALMSIVNNETTD